MDDERLSTALSRAEQALDRIDRAIETAKRTGARDDRLRARVRDAVAELDEIIRFAESEA